MAQQQRPSVSVVIPSFSARQLLEKNIPAVFACLDNGDEIVLVEDAGTDDTVAWLQNQYHLQSVATPVLSAVEASLAGEMSECKLLQAEVKKQVTLTVIQNQRNLRFGAAANRGVALARHNLIFLLNNDVTPAKDVLEHLVPHFADKKVFAVGCLEQDGSQQSGKNRLWFERGRFFHSRAADMNSGETAWVSGGSGLFDKQKWCALGGFAKAYYPAYWEDIDLSYRARQKGWKVLFEAKAQVEHGHETTHDDVFGQQKMVTMSWQHGEYFTWHHGNWWQKIQFLLWWPYHTYKITMATARHA